MLLGGGSGCRHTIRFEKALLQIVLLLMLLLLLLLMLLTSSGGGVQQNLFRNLLHLFVVGLVVQQTTKIRIKQRAESAAGLHLIGMLMRGCDSAGCCGRAGGGCRRGHRRKYERELVLFGKKIRRIELEKQVCDYVLVEEGVLLLLLNGIGRGGGGGSRLHKRLDQRILRVGHVGLGAAATAASGGRLRRC